MTPTVVKDLSKIEFDAENRCEGMDCFSSPTPDIMGVHTTSTGVTYYGCMFGGDWEFPVYFIIYWDGKELRGYIPTDGQCYDVKSKAAYGSGDEEEPEDAAHDPDMLLADIESRIVIKGSAPVPKSKTKKTKKVVAKKPTLPPITSAMIFPVNHNPPIWSVEADGIRNSFHAIIKSCGDPSKRGEYFIKMSQNFKDLAKIINDPTISVVDVICALERIAHESEQGLDAVGYALYEVHGNTNSTTSSPVMTERYGQILASDFLARSLIDNCHIPEWKVREAREKFPLIRPNPSLIVSIQTN